MDGLHWSPGVSDERIGKSRVNDMAGKAAREATNKLGNERMDRGDASDIDGQTDRSKWAGAHESVSIREDRPPRRSHQPT